MTLAIAAVRCAICRTYIAPTRSRAWHEATDSHKANVHEPERRIRAGERTDRGKAMLTDGERTELDELAKRYEAGIAWLIEHDPAGAFYFWFKSGIQPHHKMPAQDEARRDEYKAYHHAYTIWLALDKKLLRLERKAAAPAAEGVPA